MHVTRATFVRVVLTLIGFAFSAPAQAADLTVSSNLMLPENTYAFDNVTVSNGAGNLSDRLGGGAGGSVYVTAGTLTGAGAFVANGAASGNANAGGGGGGRIAVYYTNGAAFTGRRATFGVSAWRRECRGG